LIQDFETISHTADLQIRVYGKTLEQLFEHAVSGMFQSVRPTTNEPGCAYQNDRLVCKNLPISRSLKVSAADIDLLLVDFLSELLSLSDIYNEAYLRTTVRFENPTSLQAIVYGIPITGFDVVEIKAVTYAGVSIQQRDGVWSTDLVFDI
jgi:SHS2 domain-containing protein